MDGETIFAILAGAALAVFSLVMVAYSFFRGSSAAPGQTQPPPASDDGVGLDSIYDSIDTLELEYHLGNLPEDQYREQLQGYRLEAAAVIKAQLEQGAAPPDLLLEQEVMAARAAIRSAQPADEDGSEPADGWRACPQCDAPIPAALGLSGGSCPHCGAPVSIQAAEQATEDETGDPPADPLGETQAQQQ